MFVDFINWTGDLFSNSFLWKYYIHKSHKWRNIRYINYGNILDTVFKKITFNLLVQILMMLYFKEVILFTIFQLLII